MTLTRRELIGGGMAAAALAVFPGNSEAAAPAQVTVVNFNPSEADMKAAAKGSATGATLEEGKKQGRRLLGNFGINIPGGNNAANDAANKAADALAQDNARGAKILKEQNIKAGLPNGNVIVSIGPQDLAHRVKTILEGAPMNSTLVIADTGTNTVLAAALGTNGIEVYSGTNAANPVKSFAPGQEGLKALAEFVGSTASPAPAAPQTTPPAEQPPTRRNPNTRRQTGAVQTGPSADFV